MIKHYKEMQIVFSISNYEAIYNALYLNGTENILEEDGLIKIYFSENESNELYKLRKFLINNVGLKEKDIVLEFNNEKIISENSLAKIIMKYNPGDEVVLKVIRDGKEKIFEVTLGERSE